jgi:hypothetical protein
MAGIGQLNRQLRREWFQWKGFFIIIAVTMHNMQPEE